MTWSKYWKKKLLLHKSVCSCAYIISNITVCSEVQTYKLNPLVLGEQFLVEGYDYEIHNGCNVPFEYPVWNFYNILYFTGSVYFIFLWPLYHHFSLTLVFELVACIVIYMHKYIYVNGHSTLNCGRRFQGPIVLLCNVGYILNQNYRV